MMGYSPNWLGINYPSQSKREDHLAGALALGCFGERGLDLADSKGLVDGEMQLARGAEVSQLFKDLVLAGLGRLFFPSANPKTSECEIFKNKETIGDFEGLTAHGSVGDQATVLAEGMGEVQGAGSSHGIQSQLD